VVSHDLLVRMAAAAGGVPVSLEAVWRESRMVVAAVPSRAYPWRCAPPQWWTCVRDFARALRHAAVFPPRCAPARGRSRCRQPRVEAGLRLNTADLSEGGVFLRSDLLFEVGESLSLEIPLAAGETLAPVAEWRGSPEAGPARPPRVWGIEFRKTVTQDRRRLTQSLRRLAQPAGRKSA